MCKLNFTADDSVPRWFSCEGKGYRYAGKFSGTPGTDYLDRKHFDNSTPNIKRDEFGYGPSFIITEEDS